MKFADKLDELMRSERLTQTEIGKLIGKSQSLVARWVKDDRSPDYETMARLADILRVPLNYLSDNTGTIKKSRKVPVIGSASCGVPNERSDDVLDWISIPHKLYHKDAYAVIADGDSMEDTISDGAVVVVDPSEQVDNGNIVHYTLDGSESGIKRFERKGNIVILKPINRKYEDLVIDTNEHELKFSRVIATRDNLQTL